MKNCLIVLQPREIPECLDSIRKLPIDKLYMRAFDEPSLCDPINSFIRDTDYDNYLILSDDVIANVSALTVVESLLEKYEAATGYCLVSQEDTIVNVTRGPLRSTYENWPVTCDYDFYQKREIDLLQNPLFVSWFGGWCLTGFRRKIWLKNPFRVMPSGKQSDYATCIRYGKRIMSHRDSYIIHLKPGLMSENKTNFMVGRKRPEMVYEKNLHFGSNLAKSVAHQSPLEFLPFI